MPYIYHVQVESRSMRQVELESELPLTESEMTEQAIRKFKSEYGDCDEIEVGEAEIVSRPNEPESEELRKFLTFEEAVAMLPDTEYVHTFRQASYNLIGADLSREELVEAFKNYRVELSGENATRMGHKIAFVDSYGPVFVKTK